MEGKVKILNIYGQYDNHTEAKIVGNREGLESLHRAILRALASDASSTSEEREPLFASDGEGYEVIVKMNNEQWGLKNGAYIDTFWNREESNPQYVFWEIQKAKAGEC